MSDFETKLAGQLVFADIGKVINFKTTSRDAQIDIWVEGELREIAHVPDGAYLQVAGLDNDTGDKEEFVLDPSESEVKVSIDRIDT